MYLSLLRYECVTFVLTIESWMISKENTDNDHNLEDVFPLFGRLEPAVRRVHRVHMARSREKEEKGAHLRENFTSWPSKFYDPNSILIWSNAQFPLRREMKKSKSMCPIVDTAKDAKRRKRPIPPLKPSTRQRCSSNPRRKMMQVLIGI